MTDAETKQLHQLKQEVQAAYDKITDLIKKARRDYNAEDAYDGVEAMTYSYMLIGPTLKSICNQIEGIITPETDVHD